MILKVRESDGTVVASFPSLGDADGRNHDGHDLVEAATLDGEDFSPGLRFKVVAGALVAELEALKLDCVARIDEAAEIARSRFLTAGAGQALTYQRKEEEARAWTSGSDPAAFPFLASEAIATSVTVNELAAIVVLQADAWRVVGAAIEGLRMGAKKAVRDATTVAAAHAATNVAWPQPA